ncbi:MAG: hypothetical protein ACFCUQ_01350, partial [Kiloniellales bacterium]
MIAGNRGTGMQGAVLSPEGALAAARPRLLEPGLRRLEPGIEHYRVRGGGSVTFLLEPGDRLTLRDLEGRQACELVVFGSDGRPDLAALDAKADGPATGLQAILVQPDEDAAAVRAALARRGIDPARAEALRLFGGESRPGAEVELTTRRAATCIVAA